MQESILEPKTGAVTTESQPTPHPPSNVYGSVFLFNNAVLYFLLNNTMLGITICHNQIFFCVNSGSKC